jgi:hypothetical protein
MMGSGDARIAAQPVFQARTGAISRDMSVLWLEVIYDAEEDVSQSQLAFPVNAAASGQGRPKADLDSKA